MNKLKIAVIGAGSTYTPELIDGFLTRYGRLDVSAFYMMDIDSRKNGIISALARRMIAARGLSIPVVETSCLEEAITGASYVLAQVRVGQLPARVLDEKIPLKYDFIGQETTGVGGFFKALRTLPVIENVARIIEEKAPGAWLINFSNPSGILAEMLNQRGNTRSIGLCNGPTGVEKLLHRKVDELTGIQDEVLGEHVDQMSGKPVKHLGAMGQESNESACLQTMNSGNFAFDFVGLNHFNWVTDVTLGGKSIIQKLFTDKEIKGHASVQDDGFLQRIGGIPSGYLKYYYSRDKTLADSKASKTTRGEDCMAIEEDLLKLYQDETLNTKPALLEKRGGAFYSEAAVSLIDAIENDRNSIHVVNTPNRGAIPFLQPQDVTEVKCIVGRDGLRPLPLANPQVSLHIQGMVQMLKAYEKLTIKAGLEGDYDAGLAALLTHPLLGDYERTKAVYNEMLEAHRAYLPRFFK